MNRKGVPGEKLRYLRKREEVHAALRRATAQRTFKPLPRPKREKRG